MVCPVRTGCCGEPVDSSRADAIPGVVPHGDAQLFYLSLPQVTRQGPIAALAQALEECFAPGQRAEIHRAAYEASRQEKEESASACYENGRVPVAQSYPNMAAADRDVLAKEQFLAGLDSRSTRVRVRELALTTLDAALHKHSILQGEEQATLSLPVCWVAQQTQLEAVTKALEAISVWLAGLEHPDTGPPALHQRQHDLKSHHRQRKGCDGTPRPPPKFEKDQLVILHSTVIPQDESAKFHKFSTGPAYVIQKVIDDVTVRIASLSDPQRGY